MNSSNGTPGWTGLFGSKRGLVTLGARPGRRVFRPVVAGLEGRQLMSGSTLGTVTTFNGSNQAGVSALVMDTQGDFFGTTSAGGEGGTTKGDATIFEIPAGSTKVTTIASFDGAKGYGISGVTLDAQGNLYGTLSGEGGLTGDGSVFEIARGSKTVTTIARFNGTNGMFPDGVVADAQGNLYGTTAVGGVLGGASVYEIAKGSGTITPIASFSGTGSAPKGLMIDAQGDLFGTNVGGGAGGAGSVFEIARGSNTVTTVATLNGLSGPGLSNVTLDGQGDLFGTSEDGGQYGAGSVFEIARGSNIPTTIASFDTLNGSGPDPVAGLVMDGQGNLFGTTEAGGAYSDGTVFEIARGSNTITPLTSFTSNNGELVSGLLLDGQGNLVGTMEGTGGSGGTVVKLALSTTTTKTTTTTTNPMSPTPASSVETTKKPAKVAVSHQSVAKAHQNLMKQKIAEMNVIKKG